MTCRTQLISPVRKVRRPRRKSVDMYCHEVIDHDYEFLFDRSYCPMDAYACDWFDVWIAVLATE